MADDRTMGELGPTTTHMQDAYTHSTLMLLFQIDTLKDTVADKAISVIEEYRAGKHHGREVLCILGPLFEAVNDVVERQAIQAHKD